MELYKCSRCGAFHTNPGDVCSKCANTDNLELSTFNSYIQQNGFTSIDTVATETGIAQKNVSRFMGYQNIDVSSINGNENFSASGRVLN